MILVCIRKNKIRGHSRQRHAVIGVEKTELVQGTPGFDGVLEPLLLLVVEVAGLNVSEADCPIIAPNPGRRSVLAESTSTLNHNFRPRLSCR